MARRFDPSTAPAGCGADDTDRLPRALSPSRTQDFLGCPAKFYFRSILRIPSPVTYAQAKGTLTHAALERLFDHPRGERTPEIAVSYVQPEWEKMRDGSGYQDLIASDPGLEQRLLDESAELARRYFGIENPNVFDPVGRELRISANVSGVPMLGVIDRLDRVTYPDGSEKVIISDYKTGKVPAPDDRYLSDKFFGMRTYTLLVQEELGVLPDQIRLIYVAGGTRGSVRAEQVTSSSAGAQRDLIKDTYRTLRTCAKEGAWPTVQQPLCQWCEHMDYCPAWHPQLAGLPPEQALPDEVQVSIAARRPAS